MSLSEREMERVTTAGGKGEMWKKFMTYTLYYFDCHRLYVLALHSPLRFQFITTSLWFMKTLKTRMQKRKTFRPAIITFICWLQSRKSQERERTEQKNFSPLCIFILRLRFINDIKFNLFHTFRNVCIFHSCSDGISVSQTTTMAVIWKL